MFRAGAERAWPTGRSRSGEASRVTRATVVRLAIVGAIVAVAALGYGVLGDDPGGGPQGGPGDGAAATSQAPAAPPSAEEHCEAFLRFVEAANAYSADPSEAAAGPLRESAQALVDLGRPVELPPPGLVSLVELVNGSLSALPGGEQVDVPDEVEGVAPDATLRDEYLAQFCPA
jgi:hypothetical protein